MGYIYQYNERKDLIVSQYIMKTMVKSIQIIVIIKYLKKVLVVFVYQYYYVIPFLEWMKIITPKYFLKKCKGEGDKIETSSGCMIDLMILMKIMYKDLISSQ